MGGRALWLDRLMSNPAKTEPSMPRASVIIPAFNNAATLGRALEALAAQDYANFHVVVVDDCSTDNLVTVDFCQVDRGRFCPCQ